MARGKVGLWNGQAFNSEILGSRQRSQGRLEGSRWQGSILETWAALGLSRDLTHRR